MDFLLGIGGGKKLDIVGGRNYNAQFFSAVGL